MLRERLSVAIEYLLLPLLRPDVFVVSLIEMPSKQFLKSAESRKSPLVEPVSMATLEDELADRCTI